MSPIACGVITVLGSVVSVLIVRVTGLIRQRMMNDFGRDVLDRTNGQPGALLDAAEYVKASAEAGGPLPALAKIISRWH